MVEDEWLRIKGIADLAVQAEELRTAGLDRTVCKGLVDVRKVDPEHAPFGYRDDVRGRSWARPVVARILVRALGLLRKELPKRFVSIGDVSQPGCGQLEHGALVRLLSDDDPPIVTRPGAPADLEPVGAATAMLNQARLRAGVPTVVELNQGRDLRGERYRCAFPEEPVMVEHRILGQDKTKDGKLLLKTVSGRYRPLLAPSPEDLAGFAKRLKKLMRRGALVEQRRVLTWDEDKGNVEVWVQRWASATLRKQLEVVSSVKLRSNGSRFVLTDALEIRRARWQNRKPGSFRGETRWIASIDGQGQQRWSRWKKLYEAGHITHLAGRDADLSYVTVGNTSHFRVDVASIDAKATWSWFEAMAKAAGEAGVQIDRLIVDRKVKRHLRSKLPRRLRKGKLWRKIRVVSGHDGHHHVRFTRASQRLERKAIAFLEGSCGLKVPPFGM